MRISEFGRYAVTICTAGALLSGCGRSFNAVPGGSNHVPSAITLARDIANASQYRVLYSFHGRDGSHPVAGLIDVKGTLYGTTTEGGTHGPSEKDGIVFSISATGKERVLHDFGATAGDGNYPAATLTDVNGTLYGTTENGNKYNTGTVFSITTSGKERVVYSFGEYGPSAMQPLTRVIEVNGTLYGTTDWGGRSDLGTAFSITTSGNERVLHSFARPFRTDGQHPAGDLIDVNGTLYGTTYQGGLYGRSRQCGSSPCPGDGTVFSISPTGKERVLHSFGRGTDGICPAAGLLDVNGTLYGTTTQGGKYASGTIFSLSTTGAERVLYNFGTTTNDGAVPMASLIEVNGKLYGTTEGGGLHGTYGTVFSVSTTGAGERVLHSFGASDDGAHPQATLVHVNGALYGITESGGATNHGTVFALTP
jgi:uncharacterized repeat protein (TIGR03803 family)